jgi:hypothetical protein
MAHGIKKMAADINDNFAQTMNSNSELALRSGSAHLSAFYGKQPCL